MVPRSSQSGYVNAGRRIRLLLDCLLGDRGDQSEHLFRLLQRLRLFVSSVPANDLEGGDEGGDLRQRMSRHFYSFFLERAASGGGDDERSPAGSLLRAPATTCPQPGKKALPDS